MNKIWVIILVLFQGALFAQSDTYFVLPPLLEWEAGDQDIDLYISTSSPSATVWVYNSDTSFSQTLTVTSSTVGIVNLTNTIPALQSTYGARELNWTNQSRYKDALFVESTLPVTVTERIVHQYNQEIITAKGKNALGTEFYVASQTLINSTVSGSYQGYHGMHYISVVATEDSTKIRFQAKSGNIFDNGLDSVVFFLNAGQSWVSTMEDDDVLLGARVLSNKPIAVTAGGNHLKNSSANNADAGIDQVTPIELLGTKYVVLRGMANYPQDYFMWIVTEDSTDITVDGSTITTNAVAGTTGTYSMPGNSNTPGKPFVIESTRPIYIFQVTTGTTSHDPEQGMAQLPHVECTGSTFIHYNRATGLATSALITVPTAAVSDLNYNNSPITLNSAITTQQSSYDPTWTGVYIGPNTLSSSFTLDCTTPFHVGILAGEGTSTGLYGYISGFDNSFKILDPVYAQPVNDIPLGALCATPIPLYFGYQSCVDSITVINTSILTGVGSVVDSNARDTILHTIIDPTYSGPVKIKMVVEDDNGEKDSVFFEFDYFGTTYDPIFLDTLSVCSSIPTTVAVTAPSQYVSYLWSNGDTNAFTTVNVPGWLWVTVDLGSCIYTDSVYLKDGSLFEPISTDTYGCDSLLFTINDPVLQGIYWPSLSSNSTSVWFTQTGYYPFIATDINGCTSEDSIHYRLIPPPFIDEGFNCPNYTLTATGYTAFIEMTIGGLTYSEPTLDTLFPYAGSHELTLIAVDSCNNLDTIHSILEVDCIDNMLLYVPTAFSPNNDGINDAYCLNSSLPSRTKYAIYDRWGNELFSGPATECWDPQLLGQTIPTGALSLRTITILPSQELHIDEFTIFCLP
jgi:gliding motility-associated-like protein